MNDLTIWRALEEVRSELKMIRRELRLIALAILCSSHDLDECMEKLEALDEYT